MSCHSDQFRFVIPLVPRTKKNSQRILTGKGGRRYVAPSEIYKQYEKEAAWFVPKNVCVEWPVNIQAVFYMPTRRRVDLTNLLEALDDVLVRCGYLRDDDCTIVCAHDGSRVRYDKDKPRTEVVVTRMGLKEDAWTKQ